MASSSKQLPPDLEVQEVLHALESSGTSSEARTLRLWDIFRKLSKTEERFEACLTIIRAAGQCKTFDNFDFGGARLSLGELEALLEVLQSNTSLQQLTLNDWNSGRHSVNAVWTEDSCKLLAHYLRNNISLERLDASYSEMTSAGVGHIAESLAINGRCPLKYLHLLGHSIEDEEGWKHVKVLLAALPVLKEFTISISPGMTDEGAQTFGEAVARHKSLEHLTINDPLGSVGKEGGVDAWRLFLATAFTGLRSNQSIRQVEISCPPSTMLVISGMLAENKSITYLRVELWWWITSPDCEGFNRICKSLQYHNTTLQRLAIEVTESEESDDLVDLLLANTPLKSLHVLGLRDIDWVNIFEAMRNNTIMKSLCLRGRGKEIIRKDYEALAKLFQANTPLEEFGIKIPSTLDRAAALEGVFEALQDNTNLKRLDLSWSYGLTDVAFTELMGVLQVNGTLEEVKLYPTSWSEDGKAALVRQALLQKARQETYLAVLRDNLVGNLRAPTTGRVFFCGQPHAGKTRLATTMMLVAKKKWKWFHTTKEYISNERTKGIEIQVMRNDKDMQILSWDLAGQELFRVLQQHLFPKLNRTCLYLFLFSPWDAKSKKMKQNIGDCFKVEFRQWLRFICTNSNIIGRNLPGVIVVFTHKDKLKSTMDICELVEAIMDELREEFANAIHIFKLTNLGFFFINSTKKVDVKPIVKYVGEYFKEILNKRSIKVPNFCCEVSQWFIEYALDNPQEPILDMSRFSSLCETIQKDCLNTGLQGETKVKVLQAMVQYLHDVGTIIELPKVGERKLIVVNPNWLTNIFLGPLFGIGHGFENTSTNTYKLKDGHVSVSSLHQFLHEKFMKDFQKNKYVGLNRKLLVDVMVGLDLCHEVCNDAGHSTYFAPVLFEVENDISSSHLQWAGGHKDHDICLGLRIRCENPVTTYLMPATFSRFQVHIQRKLEETFTSPSKSKCVCKRGLISFYMDGHDILVENNDAGDCVDWSNHVDVMMKSNQSREVAWSFLSRYIVEEMREFYASPKGTPGVTLVIDILQEECVKRLSPSKHRQAISICDLKKCLKASIARQTTIENNGLEDHNLYMHTWPMIELEGGGRIPAESVPTLNLLLPAKDGILNQDTREVLQWIQDADQVLGEKIMKVKEVTQEIDESVNWKSSYASTQLSTTKLSKTMSHKRSSSTTQILDVVNHGFANISNQLEDVKNVVLSEIKTLTIEIQGMRKEYQTSLSLLMKKLDAVVGYSESLIAAEMPRHPYLTTNDVGVTQNICAYVGFRKALKLHFMCENRYGRHIIPNQEGYDLLIDKENCEKLRLMTLMTIKVLWFLVKAGVQWTTSAGNLMPNLDLSGGTSVAFTSVSFSGSGALLIDSVDQKISNIESMNHVNTSPIEEAWLYMKDVLKPKLNGKYGPLFDLHKVQYAETESNPKSIHAWLCGKCCREGDIHLIRH